ncbi:MAG: 16S rRNA (cytosine(1402)-N(4))-methyltransferase RsmH [Oscillospiraceae bacterium]
MSDIDFRHVSVLLNETIEGLNIKPDGIYVDGTAGGAGHSSEIAKRLTTGRLIALDKDPEAVATATERLSKYPCASVIHSDFAEIPLVLDSLGIDKVDGVLLDLGVSSHQLDDAERGFSYHSEAPLDMRMSKEGLSAYDLVNGASGAELAKILYDYGEEKFAPRIVNAILDARAVKPIETTTELADIVRNAVPAAVRRKEGHPARKTFQAIRIAVNGELDRLSEALDRAFDRLAPGGRFAIITFHSLEDRMVKQAFAEYARGCTCPPEFPVCVCGKTPRGKLVSRKPIEPTEEELEINHRSRSAKLRIIEKL